MNIRELRNVDELSENMTAAAASADRAQARVNEAQARVNQLAGEGTLWDAPRMATALARLRIARTELQTAHRRVEDTTAAVRAVELLDAVA